MNANIYHCKIAFLYISLIFLISCKNPSQEKADSSGNPTSLKEAYAQKKEKEFLENFPQDFSSFKNTFGWNDKNDLPQPLYKESEKYIDYWFSLIQKKSFNSYEKQIISISQNGQWEADAVNYFKYKSLDYIKRNKKYALINSLQNSEAKSVIRFLFDPSHTDYNGEFISNFDNDKQEMINKLVSNSNSPEKSRSSFSSYEKNPGYFIKTFDVNKDGISDKIVSSKPYQGEDLFIFFGNDASRYTLALETTNFSEDGGNIIENIYPITNANGIMIKTYFPDKGYFEKEYYIVSHNNTWILRNIIYKTMSDNSEDAVKYVCDVLQNIDITRSGWTNKINPIPEENERSRKCRVEEFTSDNTNYTIQDSDGFTNLRKEKNSSSKVLQKIKSGEHIEVLNNSEDWFLVKTKEGKKGYVHKSRVKSE